MAVPSLDDLQLFLAVARERSFARAARGLDIPAATLSRRIQRLERSLDAQLLRRTTRRVALTDAGELLLERAGPPLAGVEAAIDCLAEESTAARGRLRIAMPADLARLWLARPLADFASRHPEIRLELMLSSRVADLIEERIDLAIRAAEPDSGNLVARPLSRLPTALYASPVYVAGLPGLRHPRDLESVNAIVLRGRAADSEWTLAHGAETAQVTPRGNLEADELGAVVALAAAGAGVALLPQPLVAASREHGQLVRVLPGWQGPEAPVHAVYLSRRMPRRLRLLLEHLRGWLEAPSQRA